MKRLVALIAGLFLAALCGPLRAAPPDGLAVPTVPGDRILQQELRQEQLRVTTQRVADQLETIIAEFDRNAISGEDVQMLKAIRRVLGKLSEKEMQLVVQFLQKSRENTDATAANRQATEAYGLQQVILNQLKQLVLEYQRQQELYELSLRFKELARRQSENMWLGVSLAKSAENKTSYKSLDESQRISLQLQQSQQAPLREETILTVTKLEKLVKELGDGPTGERARVAGKQAREGGLAPALDAATEELKNENYKLLSAIGNEKKARDQMREVARLLILAQDPEQALRQALHELDRAIDQQKKVREDTAKIESRRDADSRALDEAQVVDNTDLIRRDVDNLAPVAAEQLKKAIQPMQDARTVLASNDDQKKRREQALPQQDEALVALHQARQSLADQLAKTEAEKMKPVNTFADLKQLRDEVRELIKQEEQLKAETATTDKKGLPARAPDQGALKDKAQDIQARAAQASPSAADALGEAASQMNRAQVSLAKAQNNAPAQQAAIDALQKAEQQLDQDIAKLEQAEKDLATLEDLLKKLEPIIENQQKVQLDTARESTKEKQDKASQLADRQKELGQQTGALKQEAAAPAPEAAKHLEDAQQNMSEAKSELGKPSAKTAQKEQTEALADLYAAKHSIEKKADELRDLLGQPPEGNEQALEDAMKAIEEAQKDVNQAQADLQQAPPGLMEALQQQQKEIADALGEMRQEKSTPQTAPPLAQAQQAANQAAQQLSRKDLKNAVEAMKQARSAMDQAAKGGPPDPEPQGNQPGEKPPSLGSLTQQQSDVQKVAEAMLAAQERAPKSSMKKAAQAMQKAGQRVQPLTTGQAGDLPDNAEQSLEVAMEALEEGTAQAEGGKNPPAQMSAEAASQALAQARAALAMAQAGLGSQPGQSPGQQSGQGQQPGQGKQPGRGQASTKGAPPPRGDGQRGNWEGAGGSNGPRNTGMGSSAFTGLPKRDRAAILQSQSEKYPQEYGPLVEQYLKNLADQSGNETR